MAALHRMAALAGAAMRTTVAVAGSAAALASIAAPADPVWVVTAVTISLVWAAVFAWTALRSGLRDWLIVTDVALTATLCLGQGWLVASPILPGGVSWIAGLATMSIVITSFAWRPPAAVPAGLIIVAAHYLGARWAEATDGGVVPAGIQVVQVAATALLMRLLRKAAESADTALAHARHAQQVAEATRALRAEQREQNRRLHNTALATLIAVGTGACTQTSAMLRERARADIAAITHGHSGAPEPAQAALDTHLLAAADGVGVAVRWHLDPLTAPAAVAIAFTDAAVEALTNVARHAGGSPALVRLSTQDGVIQLAITDRGPGIRCDPIPGHRYGIREGIIGRMRAVDGDADVQSGPEGTTVTLRWPR